MGDQKIGMHGMTDSLNWKRIAIGAGLLLMAVYPLIHGDPYIMHIFILFFIWSLVASNWNLLMGYAGIFSLGNIAFLAIGAYTSGILSKNLSWSPWLCILLGGIASMALVTVFIGLPALRLSGIYIALLSLIFADSLPTILTQTRSLTGGAMGLHDVPPLFEGILRIHSYYICFALFLVMLTIIYRTIHSATGLAFVALRDSREFARSLGISEYREKLKVFALVSFLTGIVGGFYVHYLGDISPTTLTIEPFLLTIAMMEMGGIGRFPGAVLGAVIIVFGNEFLRLAGTLRLALLGALICAIILFFPGGLMQLVDWIDTRIAARRRRAHG
ncbi:MAG: branched-chain amino acid ABC transporter permease [Desulfobacteraceae bacterium]|nr:branched-chain amino acid ABC transporter permease [Desulfobacteraceae bacterium]